MHMNLNSGEGEYEKATLENRNDVTARDNVVYRASCLCAACVFVNGAPDPKAPKGASVVDMKISAQVRIIPTIDKNYDFGLMDNVDDNKKDGLGSTLQTVLAIQGTDADPRIHSTEAGRVSHEFWRVESKLNFDFLPKDDTWRLYFSLECDAVLDTEEVDGRCRNFGLERLHGEFALPWINSRFHAGWDLYATDGIVKTEPTLSIGGSLSIYGDDDPGIWIDGGAGPFTWQVGIHKKVEFNATQNAQTRGSSIDSFARHPDPENSNPDRVVTDANITYKFLRSSNLVRLIWVQDQIRNPSDDSITGPNSEATESALVTAASNKQSLNVVSQYLGLLYHGTFINEILSVTAQWTSQTGEATNTGKCNSTRVDADNPCDDDYDINASQLYFNVTSGIWRGSAEGLGGRLGISYLWTSGDDKQDDELNGLYRSHCWTTIFSTNRW